MLLAFIQDHVKSCRYYGAVVQGDGSKQGKTKMDAMKPEVVQLD